MRGRRERIDDLNYWPSIADFMLALFMIALILGLTNLTLFYSQQPSNLTEGQVALQKCKEENDKLTKENKRLSVTNAKLTEDNKILSETNAGLTEDINKLSEANAKLIEDNNTLSKINTELVKDKSQHEKKPPNIEYTAKDGLTFESNSADTIGFKDFLAKDPNGFLNWKDNIIKIHPEVNTIEIIGHTDDRKVTSVGNFDENLPRALSGDLRPYALKSGSNADLGLWRAVAVMQQWTEWVNGLPENEEKKRLQELDVRCYSAAYGIPPKNLNNLQGDNLKAVSRRIEIRFTELKQ